jgi:hypothetical protein
MAATLLEVEVALREMPDLDALAERWRHLDEPIRRERLRRAALVAELYEPGARAHHPVWLWRLGDCAVLGHPGEAYSQLQVDLRRRFPSTAVLVLNNVNAPRGGPGWVYLPTAGAYEHDIYQAWQTPLAAGSLERVVAVVEQAMVRELDFASPPHANGSAAGGDDGEGDV